MAQKLIYTLCGTPWYIHVGMATCIGLGIASFIVPPLGAIDGSVL